MKKFMSLCLATTLSMGMIGCGSTQGESTPVSGGTEEQVNVSVPAGKKGTVEIWSMFTGADGRAFPDLVDKYNATNPDYTVLHRAMTQEDLYLKLQMAVASGEGVPDMAVNHVERLPLFIEDNKIIDLSPYLGQAEIEKDSYNEKSWGMSQVDDGQYAVPLDVHSYILWANMDLIEKYGITDLDDGVLTWDEIAKSAEIVKADGIVPIGLGWMSRMFLGSYAQLGGVLSQDGTVPSFNNDIAVTTLEKYREFVELGNTQKDGEDAWKMFLGGNMLYMPEGVWMYNAIKESDINIKGFDYPVFDVNQKGSWTSSHQITIPYQKNMDDERIQASLKFVKFIEENAQEWAVAGLVPASKVALEDETFNSMPQSFLATENEELKIYDYKYFGYATDAIDKVIGDIMFGKISIEDGLKQAEQETKDNIEMN